MHLVSQLKIVKKEKALQTFKLAFLPQVKMVFPVSIILPKIQIGSLMNLLKGTQYRFGKV